MDGSASRRLPSNEQVGESAFLRDRLRAARSGWTIRTRLFLLVLSVALPAVLALSYSALQTWRTAQESTTRALASRAEALAAAIARELALARVGLENLATSPSLAAGDLAGFHRQLEAVPKPDGARIILTGPDGYMLVNSLLPFGAPLPAREDSGIVRRVFETALPQVSDLYTGPVTREPLIAIDVPVRGPEGRVIYDLNMGFRAAAFGRVIGEQRLPGSWRAALLDRQGRIIARSHGFEEFSGQPAALRSLKAIAAGNNPFLTTSQEGLEVWGVHAPVPGSGWTAVVVVPTADLRAPLLRGLLEAVLVGGGLLLFGLGMAAWQARRIAGPVSALASGASALARGEMPPPITPGVDEASQVSEALVEAATALRARAVENEREARRRTLMVAELNHRVKNTLATVQAMATQTLRGAGGDPARFAADLNGRLQALARAHDLVARGEWGEADLVTVVRTALTPWMGNAAPSISLECGCGGQPPRLRPTQAQALVLALHELATNATKYGALSREGGQVCIRCRPDGDGMVLVWAEVGGPPLNSEARQGRRGFGTRMIERALPHDLGPGAAVTLQFAPDGLKAEIRVPQMPDSGSGAGHGPSDAATAEMGEERP